MNNIKPLIVGIAGGSGSGKSTLAILLCKKYPQKCRVLHLDDYFKNKENVPMLSGFTNWDHPTSLRLDDFYKDLLFLKNGIPVSVLTKSELYNPTYNYLIRNKIEYLIEPAPIIIVEGYLCLYDKRIRDLIDINIYLDIPIQESSKRRGGNKFFVDEVYFEKVLQPMHVKYVEPTKKYANMVISVLDKKLEDILKLIEIEIFK